MKVFMANFLYVQTGSEEPWSVSYTKTWKLDSTVDLVS